MVSVKVKPRLSNHGKWAGLNMISSNANTGSSYSSWSRSLKDVDKLLDKGINFLIIFVALELWKQVTVLFSILLPSMSTKWNIQSKKALFGA